MFLFSHSRFILSGTHINGIPAADYNGTGEISDIFERILLEKDHVNRLFEWDDHAESALTMAIQCSPHSIDSLLDMDADPTLSTRPPFLVQAGCYPHTHHTTHHT